MTGPKSPLAKWLEAQPESQAVFAGEWGISEPYLSQIAGGTRVPKPKLAEKIEQRTGIDAREILGIPKREPLSREAARC